MKQLSKKMSTFAPSAPKSWRNQGVQLSFDPSENLENSKYTGEKILL